MIPRAKNSLVLSLSFYGLACVQNILSIVIFDIFVEQMNEEHLNRINHGRWEKIIEKKIVRRAFVVYSIWLNKNYKRQQQKEISKSNRKDAETDLAIENDSFKPSIRCVDFYD